MKVISFVLTLLLLCSQTVHAIDPDRVQEPLRINDETVEFKEA